MPLNSARRRARFTARRWVHRFDNPEVGAARRFLKRLRTDPPDVLYLGESAVTRIAPYDTDRRTLGRMVSDELGEIASVHVIAGAGYSARLFLAYLHLLEGQEARPLVVHPLWVRGYFRPWFEHPVYAHEAALGRIRRLDPQTPLWRASARFPGPTPEEFDRHGELPFETLMGPRHVRDYTGPLRGQTGLSEDERVRLLYAYHQGHRLSNRAPELEPLTCLARQLEELGVETVLYHSPVSVRTGVDLLGPEFEELTRYNRAVVEEAYAAGRSERVQILQTGDIFAPDEFDDPRLADEHLNERGRVRLAEMISAAVQAGLARRPAGGRGDRWRIGKGGGSIVRRPGSRQCQRRSL